MTTVLVGKALRYGVLITTMCIVEQRLYARPLTSVSDDPADSGESTPKHFFLERANLESPLLPDAQLFTDLRRRVFRKSKAYFDTIRFRRKKDSLPNWTLRNEWNKDDARQMNMSNLDWVKDENVRRSNYMVTRVLDV